MKEFIVNLDHTTRQQVTVLADTEEDAAMLVHGMFCSTDALTHLPIVSTADKIICGDVKVAMPTASFDPQLLCDECRRAYASDMDEDDDEIDLLQMLVNLRDEVEAALEHLDSALFDLAPDDE